MTSFSACLPACLYARLQPNLRRRNTYFCRSSIVMLLASLLKTCAVVMLNFFSYKIFS